MSRIGEGVDQTMAEAAATQLNPRAAFWGLKMETTGLSV